MFAPLYDHLKGMNQITKMIVNHLNDILGVKPSLIKKFDAMLKNSFQTYKFR